MIESFAAGGGVAAADAAPTVTEDSLIVHIIKSAGIVFGALLLFLSMALVALVILLALDLRMQAAIPPLFVQQFTDTVNQRRYTLFLFNFKMMTAIQFVF